MQRVYAIARIARIRRLELCSRDDACIQTQSQKVARLCESDKIFHHEVCWRVVMGANCVKDNDGKIEVEEVKLY